MKLSKIVKKILREQEEIEPIGGPTKSPNEFALDAALVADAPLVPPVMVSPGIKSPVTSVILSLFVEEFQVLTLAVIPD